MLERTSEFACAPSPLPYADPAKVRAWPSPAAKSPLLLSTSKGPHPFVTDVQLRSLRYVVPEGSGLVVNVHTLSAASGFPAVSFTPADPPLIVAIYVAPASNPAT